MSLGQNDLERLVCVCVCLVCVFGESVQQPLTSQLVPPADVRLDIRYSMSRFNGGKRIWMLADALVGVRGSESSLKRCNSDPFSWNKGWDQSNFCARSHAASCTMSLGQNDLERLVCVCVWWVGSAAPNLPTRPPCWCEAGHLIQHESNQLREADLNVSGCIGWCAWQPGFAQKMRFRPIFLKQRLRSKQLLCTQLHNVTWAKWFGETGVCVCLVSRFSSP